MISAVAPYFVLFWAAGVFAFGGRLLLGFAGLQRLKRKRIAPPEFVTAHLGELRERLGLRRPPGVFANDRIRDAMAVGFFRPIVLLPLSWLTQLPPETLRSVIAHELAHIRRWDRWVNLLQRGVETLLFYHPAVWWTSRRVRIEREHCCDALAAAAVGEDVLYAEALERVARLKISDPHTPLLATTLGGTNMALLNRVKRILGMPPSPQRGGAWAAGLLAVCLPVALCVTAFVWENAAADTPAVRKDRQPLRDVNLDRERERKADMERERPVEREREREREADRRDRPERRDREAFELRENEREPGPRGVQEREVGRERAPLRERERGPREVELELNLRDLPNEGAVLLGGVKRRGEREPNLRDLLQAIRGLQREVTQLRRELNAMKNAERRAGGDRIPREGDRPPTIRRDGDRKRQREGDRPPVIRRKFEREIREGERKLRRDGDRPRIKIKLREGDQPERPRIIKKEGDRPRDDRPRDDRPRDDRPRDDRPPRDGQPFDEDVERSDGA